MKKLFNSFSSQIALAALLIFVACSKKEYIHKLSVLPISNEGFAPLPEQFEMEQPYIIGDTLYWMVRKEYDIRHYIIKRGSNTAGIVKSVGFGLNHLYQFKINQ